MNECWLFEIATYAPGTQDAYEALGLPAPYMAAMAWVHRTPVPGEIEAHAVAAPQYRGKWMTRDVIRQLNYVVDHTGCTRMIAQVETPLTAKLWRKFGFTIEGNLAYKDIPNG